MKALNFAAFAKDKIQEKELNFLKGGRGGDPIDDLIMPPKK
jgi:hypothetical protein